MKQKKESARSKLRRYFEEHVGEIVTTHQLSEVAEIRDYQRRIRELRNEYGMQIKSHVDRADLKPGEYVLETLTPLPAISRGISGQLRVEILERNGYTCQLCGASPYDPDPLDPSRKTRLHIDHIIPISQGGTDDPDNLRALCTACNQGRSNIQTPTETALNLLARLRRVPRSVRREVFEKLKKEFGE